MRSPARPSLLFLAAFLFAGPLSAAELTPELASLRTKAEAGNAIAAYNLGLVFMQGRDVPSDFPEAFVWLSLARESGSTGKALESLLSQMTPAQLEEGQRRLAARRGGRGGSAPVAAAPPAAAASPAAPAVEVARLQEDLKTVRAENQRLAVELNSVRAEVERTKSALDAAMQGLSGARAIADAATKDAAGKTAEIESLRATIRGQFSKEEVSGMQAEMKTLQSAHAELTSQARSWEAERAKSAQALAELTAKSGALAEEVGRERVARARAEELVAQSRTATDADAKAREEVLRKRAAADAALLAALKRDLDAARTAASKSEQALQAANAKQAAAEPALAGLTAERDALAARVRQAEAAGKSAAEAESRNADLSRQLESALRDLAAAKTAAKAAPAAPPTETRVVETAGKFDDSGHGYVMVRNERGSAPAKADNAELGSLRERVAALEAERAALKQQLASAAPPAAPAAAPVAPGDAAEAGELKKQLADSEAKLSIALRSYSLVQEQNARLTADAERSAQSHAVAAIDARAKEDARTQDLNERLRQAQAQLAEVSVENARLRTRMAVAGNAPGSRFPAPTRPTAVTFEVPPPPPVAPAPAPAPAAVVRSHTVLVGETLSGISRQYYGTPGRWKEIYNANRDIIHKENSLPIGATLKIP